MNLKEPDWIFYPVWS